MFQALTLAELAATLAMLLPIGGCIIFLHKTWSRFEKIEHQAAYRQEDMAMIFEGLRGCLEGLIQNGANGDVRETLTKLNLYMSNKAAGLTGNGKTR